ncbi:uncharacterized protein LOC106026107 [Cavia porcellus]|uniref:uncharacterized protein LOC106026107 n=1 Tax=Cavia porcellus TaxID=10141 RepID=UPI000661EC9A
MALPLQVRVWKPSLPPPSTSLPLPPPQLVRRVRPWGPGGDVRLDGLRLVRWERGHSADGFHDLKSQSSQLWTDRGTVLPRRPSPTAAPRCLGPVPCFPSRRRRDRFTGPGLQHQHQNHKKQPATVPALQAPTPGAVPALPGETKPHQAARGGRAPEPRLDGDHGTGREHRCPHPCRDPSCGPLLLGCEPCGIHMGGLVGSK